jgi:nitrogenase-associated protein
MAHITFFTKLGCMTSAKQVDLLERSGHKVEVCDLLAHPWSAEELTSYFGGLPVEAWFNEKSPRVKSGEIDPSAYDAKGALTVMQADHLLIRRPLMESGGKRLCGFDPAVMHAWVGLGADVYGRSMTEDYASCSQPPAAEQKCP